MSVLFDEIDKRITEWMARYGIPLLRYSMGLIFIWFGGLKYVPGLSPAQELATSTIDLLTFGLIPLQASLIMLASLEVLIGLLIISGKWIRLSIFLLFFQMMGTLTPIFLFPELVFTQFPYGLTMEGQYIFKNMVVISAALVIGATARGGLLVPENKKKNMLDSRLKA
ncbi:MAG: DoxX family membrane protein [Cyclonatronaceae bacterium]